MSSSSKIVEICAICDQNPSKYCCPRCEIYYCSLDCYKSTKHEKCSEGFYKDCVNEELAGLNTDEESRQKMMEILKRMKDEDLGDPDELEQLMNDIQNGDDDNIDSDDEAYTDLEERIKGLDLDNADAVWNVLTEDERNEFQALLNQDDVSAVVPLWEPWWTFQKKKALVEDTENKDQSEKEHFKTCPKLLTVPKLTSLTSVQPSPAIACNITNVLASYSFLMRYFNGEVEPKEFVLYLLEICANLDGNANFDDHAMSVVSVAQNCLKCEQIDADHISIDVMKDDTFMIVQGPSEGNKSYYSKAALSHLHQILNEAKKSGNAKTNNEGSKNSFSKKFPQNRSKHLPYLDVSKVKKCIKKVEYYLSYIESNGLNFE